VQLGYPVLFLFLDALSPGRVTLIEALVLIIYFGEVAVIDIEHRLVLHPISLVGALIGLVVGYRLHGLVMTLVGGAAGFVIMLALYYLGELFSRLLGRLRGQPVNEVALGFGDVNLAGILGLVMGWPGITACLFVAILIGGLISGLYLVIMMLTRTYRAFTALPYAPFLLLSAVFLLFRP
jgi:leader peptidase (prepilin peptidase)/N-methyltransferase